MKDFPLVSVVIPTHNRARLLQEAVNSVKSQEGLGELFQLEIVVVDDGSTDETPEVAQELGEVRYIRLSESRGPSVARNEGIKAAKGKYVAFLDDDDLWLPGKLSMQVPVLESNPEIGAVYGQNWLVGEGVDLSWPDGQRAPSGFVFADFLQEDFISINTVIVRREALEKAGGFDPDLRIMEYYEFCLRLSYHVQFAFIPGNCAVQRYSSGGTWTRLVREGTYEKIHSSVIEKALALLPHDRESDELRDKARTALFAEITRALTSVAAHGWMGFDRVRQHIRAGLSSSPGLLAADSVRKMLVRCGKRISESSSSPLREVRSYCAAIRQGIKPSAIGNELRLETLLGDIWAGAALRLRTSPAYRKAGLAALISMSHDPHEMANPNLRVTVARAVLGSHILDLFIG